MFISAPNHIGFMRIFVLSAFLTTFSFSLAPTAAASFGLLETTNLDPTLNAAGHVNTLETPLAQGLTDTTNIIPDDASHMEAPKVDKWTSRPLKQFNPHEVVEGAKMIKKSGRPDSDKTGYPASKPSIRLLKRDY